MRRSDSSTLRRKPCQDALQRAQGDSIMGRHKGHVIHQPRNAANEWRQHNNRADTGNNITGERNRGDGEEGQWGDAYDCRLATEEAWAAGCPARAPAPALASPAVTGGATAGAEPAARAAAGADEGRSIPAGVAGAPVSPAGAEAAPAAAAAGWTAAPGTAGEGAAVPSAAGAPAGGGPGGRGGSPAAALSLAI